MLRVDSGEVAPAEIEGTSQDAFQNSLFIFKKPRWVPDEYVGVCNLCNNKFNQLRRKHHCRSCGEIFCNKCCLEKVPLPQFGLDTERVCNRCLPMASCVTMSHSMNPEFNLRAATGIAELCQQQPSLVVKLGGAQMLIYLSTKTNERTAKILEHVASGIHNLAHQESLVTWLASLGALSSIRNIIKDGNRNAISTLALCDSLNALRIFVKTNDQLKITAIKTNCLPSLVSLTAHQDASVSLVATSIICIIAESPRNHNAIVNHPGILSSMLTQVSSSKDEQVTEHVLKTLLTLSTGNDDVKHSLSSEDASCGGVIAKVIKSKPRNVQIIAYAANLIANLATSERDQLLLVSGMQSILSSLSSPLPDYVLVQLMKAAANFSSFPAHSTTMLQNMDNVASLLSRDGMKKVHEHAVRFVVNLLKLRKQETVSKLCSAGYVFNFLLRFSEMTQVVEDLVRSLERMAPPVGL